MTDADILDLMRKGDESSLEIVKQKYGGLIRKIVCGILDSEPDCEETIADTLFRLWSNREKIDEAKGSLKAYICMVAKSCALDKLRSLKKVEIIPIEENDIGIDVDYENEAAKRTNQQVIAGCIREMKSPDRDIFIDRYYFRKPIKAIAEKYGLKPKKVENILFRSKEKLKKALLKGGIIL